MRLSLRDFDRALSRISVDAIAFPAASTPPPSHHTAAFYVWLSVGRRASTSTRAALTRLLDRMRIVRYAAP